VRTVLITGGTGLIGAKLTRALLEQGDKVVLLDLAPALWRVEQMQRDYPGRLEILRGDISFATELLSAMHHHQPETVVHLAALLGAESGNHPNVATRVNVTGTANVLESCRLSGVKRVLLASSIALYGSDDCYPTDALPLKEDAPKYISAGLRVYGTSKLHNEALAHQYADMYRLEVGGLRLSTVYGYGRERGSAIFVSDLVERAINGQAVTVDRGSVLVSMVYVNDVADQFREMINAVSSALSKNRFFNTGGDRCTVREFANVVKEIIPEAKITVENSHEKNLVGMPASVSDDLFVATFGYQRQFTPLRIGLTDFVREARANRPSESLQRPGKRG
jgi:UDP-glucose 4-epimerase